MKPSKLRESLLHDITNDWPEFGQQPIEINTDHILPAFQDILLPVWCKAVGVSFRINSNPLPEFKSKTTIIFWIKEDEHDPFWDERIDDDAEL